MPAPHSSHPSWKLLQRQPFYSRDIPVMNCAATPEPFTTRAQFRAWATAFVTCQHAGWSKVFASIGVPLVKPKVVFFATGVRPQSPCGTSSSAAFYCGWPEKNFHTIYLGDELVTETNRGWRLRAADTIAHEYAHHIQSVTKITTTAHTMTEVMTTHEISRRIELQASCWSMRIDATTPALRFTRADYQRVVQWTGARGSDSISHGSSASRTYWWIRGLYMRRAGGCTTWLVGSNAVR